MMASMHKILIGIPVLNNLEMTRACLQRLLRNTSTEQPPELQVEILIIDNGSSEDIANLLRNEFTTSRFAIYYQRNPHNMGVAVAWNQILRFSPAPVPPAALSYDYYVISNNDALPGPDWLSPMIAAMDNDPSIGWISALENGSPVLPELIEAHELSKQYRIDPSSPFTTEAINKSVDAIYATWGGHNAFSQLVAQRLPLFLPFNKEGRSAVCFMVRPDLINELGFFDEEYWPIGVSEDLEYFLRIEGVFPSNGSIPQRTKWKAGFCGKSVVHHNWCSTHQGKDFDGRKWDKEREKNWKKKFCRPKKYFTSLLP